MFLFILPLVILIVGYGLGLWFSLTGRRLTRRFFLLPVLASLIVTVIYSSRSEKERASDLPGHTSPGSINDSGHLLPLYALRIAPLTLGICLIANAAGYLTMVSVHRRFHKPPPTPAAAGGPCDVVVPDPSAAEGSDFAAPGADLKAD